MPSPFGITDMVWGPKGPLLFYKEDFETAIIFLLLFDYLEIIPIDMARKKIMNPLAYI